MEALKKTVTLYIHYTTYQHGINKHIVSTCDMSRDCSNIVLLEKREITLELHEPDAFDLINTQVDAIRSAKESLLRMAADMDDQIQQLLCIDHAPITEDDLPY